MSEFSRLRNELEQLDAARTKLLHELELARQEEQAAEVEDMRKRIVAFNISPEQLFPELRHPKPRVRQRHRSTAPALYEFEGNTWHGKGGPKPKWLTAALAAGHTLESMRIKAKANGG